jgi:hypothetical protein
VSSARPVLQIQEENHWISSDIPSQFHGHPDARETTSCVVKELIW